MITADYLKQIIDAADKELQDIEKNRESPEYLNLISKLKNNLQSIKKDINNQSNTGNLAAIANELATNMVSVYKFIEDDFSTVHFDDDYDEANDKIEFLTSTLSSISAMSGKKTALV